MSVGARTITVAGWAGRDAEWREVNGQGVLNVSLGMDVSWQKDGEWQNRTVWVKVTRWYTQAAHAQQAAGKIQKFDKLVVIGELEEPDAWIGKDGKPSATNRITARQIQVLGKGDDRGGQGQGQSRPEQPPLNELRDEDIPF